MFLASRRSRRAPMSSTKTLPPAAIAPGLPSRHRLGIVMNTRHLLVVTVDGPPPSLLAEDRG